MHSSQQRVVSALQTWMPLVLALIAAALGVALYREIVGFTYFSDDPVYLRITQEASLIDIFASRTAFPYYRPLNLAPLEILRTLIGSAPAPIMHAMGLAIHVINGWLVGLLSRRRVRDHVWFPMLAAALYLTLPFAYQAVPWMAAMGHVQVATGLLIAIIFAERWWEHRRWGDLAGVLIGAAFANFSHENGVIGGTLIAAWLFTVQCDCSFKTLRENRKTLATAVIPALAINVLFVILWQQVSNNPAPPTDVRTNVINNLAYFAQALGYPVSQFGYRLMGAAGLSDYTAAAILSALGIGVLTLGLWLRRDRRVLGAALWYVGGIVIPTLFLDWYYVFTSPRLLMSVAPALALLWGFAILGYWEHRITVLKAAAVIVAALALIGGAWFVRSRIALEAMYDRLYRDMYAEVERGGDGVVFFNVPEWISPKERMYALGTEGIVYRADYLTFQHLTWANTGIEYTTRPVLWHDNLPLHDLYWMEYFEQFQPNLDERLETVRGADAFYRVKALPTSFALEEANPAPDASMDGALELSNGVLLIVRGFRVPERHQVKVDITLRTLNGKVEEKMFVHLLCGETVLTQADGALMGEIYPYDYWSAGETWHEVRVMEIPPGTPDDCLALRVGMFHPMTQLRPTLPDGSEWMILPVE